MFATFAFEAGKTNGHYVRFRFKLTLGWLEAVRSLLGF
jgi:hypothetical protein